MLDRVAYTLSESLVLYGASRGAREVVALARSQRDVDHIGDGLRTSILFSFLQKQESSLGLSLLTVADTDFDDILLISDFVNKLLLIGIKFDLFQLLFENSLRCHLDSKLRVMQD